jgi:hypothetical protein
MYFKRLKPEACLQYDKNAGLLQAGRNKKGPIGCIGHYTNQAAQNR